MRVIGRWTGKAEVGSHIIGNPCQDLLQVVFQLDGRLEEVHLEAVRQRQALGPVDLPGPDQV